MSTEGVGDLRKRVEQRWRAELERKYADFLEMPEGLRRPRAVHPSQYASPEDLIRLSEIQDEEGLPSDARNNERLERQLRQSSAYSRWEAELEEKYRDRPIPPGFETMEVFPYEEFADAEDRRRLQQIREEEGVATGRSFELPRVNMTVFALLPHVSVRSGQAPRSVLMSVDTWEVWRGTGPWSGWSRPVWRGHGGGRYVFLFTDGWTALEMRSYEQQWNGNLMALSLSLRDQQDLAGRLPHLKSRPGST